MRINEFTNFKQISFIQLTEITDVCHRQSGCFGLHNNKRVDDINIWMEVGGRTIKKYNFKVFGNMWMYHHAEYQIKKKKS